MCAWNPQSEAGFFPSSLLVRPTAIVSRHRPLRCFIPPPGGAQPEAGVHEMPGQAPKSRYPWMHTRIRPGALSWITTCILDNIYTCEGVLLEFHRISIATPRCSLPCGPHLSPPPTNTRRSYKHALPLLPPNGTTSTVVLNEAMGISEALNKHRRRPPSLPTPCLPACPPPREFYGWTKGLLSLHLSPYLCPSTTASPPRGYTFKMYTRWYRNNPEEQNLSSFRRRPLLKLCWCESNKCIP